MKINLSDRLINPQSDVVLIQFNLNPFFEKKYIEKCIAEMERASIMLDTLTPLQRLGMYALLDSAYIDEKEIKRMED